MKTKKVILNKCYGGFEVSKRGKELYAKKKGLNEKESEKLWLNESYREDPTLIEVVEELGAKANGDFGKLKIVEIPYDLDYVIDEYDGFETLHQKVQEW